MYVMGDYDIIDYECSTIFDLDESKINKNLAAAEYIDYKP